MKDQDRNGMRWLLAALFASAVLLAACSSAKPVATGQVTCPATRPTLCTQEKVPVCGTTVGGLHVTYTNSCTACADNEVVSYLSGSC